MKKCKFYLAKNHEANSFLRQYSESFHQAGYPRKIFINPNLHLIPKTPLNLELTQGIILRSKKKKQS